MKRENRQPVLMSDEELEEVQDYRWRKRIKSQQEAMRVLIRKGLAAEKAETASTIPAE